MDTKTEPNKFAKAFREMADRIERNDPAEFAGAILIVPPEGDVIAVLITDPSKDKEAFWALAVSRTQIAHQEIVGQRQGGQGFGRR